MDDDNNINALRGHAVMCVRMKLRKDEKDLTKRGATMTPEQHHSVMERIERGMRTMLWLKRLQSKQECQHTGATYMSIQGRKICTYCGEEIETRGQTHERS